MAWRLFGATPLAAPIPIADKDSRTLNADLAASRLYVTVRHFVFSKQRSVCYHAISYHVTNCHFSGCICLRGKLPSQLLPEGQWRLPATGYNIWQRAFLPLDLAKSRRHASGVYNFPIALKFGRRLGSTAAEPPAKLPNDVKFLTSDLVGSRLRKIFW